MAAELRARRNTPVRTQPAHPHRRHRIMRRVRVGDPAARRAPLRPAPARLLLHPGAAPRRSADGDRAGDPGVRRRRAQDLRRDARSQDRRRRRRVRARRRLPGRRVRPRRRSTGFSRWTCGSPAARPARWPCCRACWSRWTGWPRGWRPDLHRRRPGPARCPGELATWCCVAAAAWGLAAAVALLGGSAVARPSTWPGRAAGGVRAVGARRRSRGRGRGVVAAVAGTPALSRWVARSVVGTMQLQASSLAGVFTALLGLVAVALAAYAPRYHRADRGLGGVPDRLQPGAARGARGVRGRERGRRSWSPGSRWRCCATC